MQTTFFVIRWWRIARIVLHTLTGLTLASLLLPVANRWLRLGLIQWWCKHLLHCFNFKISASGHLPDARTHGVLFVANHISWSDIHAINSVIPVRFVAKQEVKDWPVFGYLVRKAGTLFINRERRRDASRVVNLASLALKYQDNLCVFPEGTTTEGLSVLPFKSSLLQAAVEVQAMVIPVTVSYPLADGSPNLQAAYAGETTLFESMARLLDMQQPQVHLHFGAPVQAGSLSRQTLAKDMHSSIAAQLAGSYTLPQT